MPRRVLAVGDGRLQVLYDGEPRWVKAPGVGAVGPGDYVLVYAGLALEQIPTAEVDEMLRFEADLERTLEEASRSAFGAAPDG